MLPSPTLGVFYFMKTSKLRVHCSDVGFIMANTKDNAPLTPYQEGEMRKFLEREKPLTERMHAIFLEYSKKQANYDSRKLTNSAKACLIEIYAKEKYHKTSFSHSFDNVSVQKGVSAEQQSIELLAKLDGVPYKKNKRKYKNKYLIGVPDIVYEVKGKKRVIDVKTSIDLNSFLCNIDKNLSFQYFFQILCYLEIVGADEGEVCFCLVNMPAEMQDQQIRRLKAQSFLAGNTEEYTEKIVEEFKESMCFNNIPEKRRVIRFKVKADKEMMERVYKRIDLSREWLKKFSKSHIYGANKKKTQAFSDIFSNSHSPIQRGEI